MPSLSTARSPSRLPPRGTSSPSAVSDTVAACHLQRGARRKQGNGGEWGVMPELKGEELKQLRSTLSRLAANLDRTLSHLDEDVRRDYRDAERSVIDARRKVETREGLLRVG